MDYTTLVAGAIGVLMPFLITLVKQWGLSKRWNLLIAIGSCALAGFLTVLAAGNVNWADWGAAALAVFGASQAVYVAFWKDSGTEAALNIKTSIIK